MTDSTGFQDQSQIERIRERLWDGREFGRAAVMVGSGFSRNAERRSASDPPFPLLTETAQAMYEALYPSSGDRGNTDQEEVRPQLASGAGALRLASEYETVFGRAALDDLLARLIPDASYEPGRLHERLLRLPWSDVFTTNYDTLLERARSAVRGRKYDLVLTASDIPAQTKPRIVKLHGSFPSHRPFIITEEDYRTYPTRFAPFVNMVQQSTMENVFCLLGFSGDDPNFLNWIGWVRDNLGSATPPIYLCGLLNLSNSQRRLLETRNVVPVDLSPLLPRDRWFDSDERHAGALEWFLLNLEEGEPPSVMDWPVPRRRTDFDFSGRLPDVPPGPRPISEPGQELPEAAANTPAEIDLDEINELHNSWRRTRLEYPGWVVASEGNREDLWRYTERHIPHVLLAVDRLSSPDNLFLLYEFNWRLERTLVPLYSDWAEKIEQALNRFNPYPDLTEIADATIKPTEAEHRQLDWHRIAECWVELTFALARGTREYQDEQQFRVFMDRLENVAQRRDDWQARWFYEECLFHLSRLDQDGARAVLNDWPENNRSPFWEAKRASIIAELGDVEAATRIAEQALLEIRSRLQPYSVNYALLSQEGWTMSLLEALEQNDLSGNRSYTAEHRGRREQLQSYGGDPVTEVDKLERTLVGPPPSLLQPSERVMRGFDTGSERVTVSFPSGLNVRPVLPAFAFLRMLEDGGLPLRCGTLDMFPATIKICSEWIEPYSPSRSLNTAVRGASIDDVYQRFDRTFVATLPMNRLYRLFDTFFNSLVQSARRLLSNSQEVSLHRTSFSQRQVRAMAELLSRLSIRSSHEQLARLFDLAKQMYESPLFQRHNWLHDHVGSLFRRILSSAMPRQEILQRVPELLALPIPGDSGFSVSTPEMWVEPFTYVDWDRDEKLEDNFDRSSWTASIANLLRIVRHGEAEARKRAAVRLERIYDIQGLTDEESRDFGEALWSRTDDKTSLPSDTTFYLHAFLRLPEPETGRAKENFRQLMLSSNFRQVVTRFTYEDGREGVTTSPSLSPDPYRLYLHASTIPLFPESEEREKLIDWTLEEANAFLQKMIDYWDEEKEALRPMIASSVDSFVTRGFVQRYRDWLRVMAEIVLPKIATADERTQDTARRLLTELEQSGVSVLLALPMLLYLNPELHDEIVHKMRAGLVSTDEEPVGGAAEGLYYWILRSSSKDDIASPPETLLDELVNRALGRRQPGLRLILAYLRDITRNVSEALSDEQISSLCLALEYLLGETSLPRHEDRNNPGQLTAPIPIDQRPEHRAVAAQLAFRLSRELERRGADIPQVLMNWERVVREDPLPEVRRAWG